MKLLKLITKGILIILLLQFLVSIFMIIQALTKSILGDDTIGLWILGWLVISIDLIVFGIINWKVLKKENINTIIFSIVSTLLLTIIPISLIIYYIL